MKQRRVGVGGLIVAALLLLAWWGATHTTTTEARDAALQTKPEPGASASPLAAAPVPTSPTDADAADSDTDPDDEMVRCVLPEALRDAPSFEVEATYEHPTDDGFMSSKRSLFTVPVDREARFPRDLFPPKPEDATLAVPGFLPTRVHWDEHGCTVDPPERAARLTGTVIGPFFDDDVITVSSCGGHVGVRPDDRAFELDVPADVDCEVFAEREDGQLRARSEVLTVVPRADVEQRVTLTVPAHRVAGLGVKSEATEAGLEVTALRRDAAAHRAGLQPGDVLLRVDGVRVGEEGSDLTAVATGEAGDTVNVEVVRGEDTLTLEVTLDDVPSDRVRVDQDGGYSMRSLEDAWIGEVEGP